MSRHGSWCGFPLGEVNTIGARALNARHKLDEPGRRPGGAVATGQQARIQPAVPHRHTRDRRRCETGFPGTLLDRHNELRAIHAANVDISPQAVKRLLSSGSRVTKLGRLRT